MDGWLVYLTYSLIKYSVSSKGIETEGCTSSFFFVCLSEPDSYFYLCEILQTFLKYIYMHYTSQENYCQCSQTNNFFLEMYSCCILEGNILLSPSKTDGILTCFPPSSKYKWRLDGNDTEMWQVCGGIMLQENPS